MVNREHMEQWINALEAYDKEPARGLLSWWTGTETRMCALGIGLNVMTPGCLVNTNTRVAAPFAFPAWLGLRDRRIQIALNPDGSGYDHVTVANDTGKQSPWTIAQRLRETYLKEEQS